MKRTLDDYFRGQTPAVPPTFRAAAASGDNASPDTGILPIELWVHHVMPVLGAAGDDVSLRTLVRLARTCRTFYKEVPWRACVSQLWGFVTERIPRNVFAGFAPTLERFCYYIPCHHAAYTHLDTTDWRRCTRLTHLMLIDNSDCYSSYGHKRVELPASVTHLTMQGPGLIDLILSQTWTSGIMCTCLGNRTLDAFQASRHWRWRDDQLSALEFSPCTLPGPRDLPSSEEEEEDGDQESQDE